MPKLSEHSEKSAICRQDANFGTPQAGPGVWLGSLSVLMSTELRPRQPTRGSGSFRVVEKSSVFTAASPPGGGITFVVSLSVLMAAVLPQFATTRPREYGN